MTMIDKVADALERGMFAPHELPLGVVLHRKYLDLARAAIEAMREPTNDMIEEGEAAHASATGYQYPGVREAWEAMIAAALEPKS